MANDPNKGWRDGVIEQFESRVPPILKTDGKPCIPVSQFWSHNQESGKISAAPSVSHFQACSEGDVFANQQKTEPEPLMGLVFFALITLKQISWGLILASIVLVIYVFFKVYAEKQGKKRAIKRSIEKQKISPESFRHEDNLGVDGAAYNPLTPIKYK